MKKQLITSWKPATANVSLRRSFRFPEFSTSRNTLCIAALVFLLPACGSGLNDEEVQAGSPAADIDEVANQPVIDAKFSMSSDEFQLTGSLPTVEVVQQARSEIYIHE